MKKLILLGLVSLFVSCTDNETILNETTETADLNMYDKSYIENATFNKKLSYKRFHLKKITTWLLKNDKDVKNALIELNNYNNGKFDTFYVESVISQVLLQNTSNDEDKMNAEIDSELEFSLNAFVDLESESWYPSIRVHDFEKYLSRSPYDSTKTLYAIDDYDEVNEEQIMAGYQENSEGELEVIDETLNEQLAGEDDIVVLELLPCTGGGGQQQLRGPCDDDGGGGQSQNLFRLRVDKMTVKYHKEGWPGRSEINFKGYSLSAPFGSGDCGNNIAGTSNCYNYSGKRIERYKRSWINNQDERTQGYQIKFQEDYITNEVVYFIIFEEDSFPAPKKTASFLMPNGDVRNFEYRSWQTFYDQQILSMNPDNNYGLPWVSGFYVDENPIKYNLSYHQ